MENQRVLMALVDEDGDHESNDDLASRAGLELGFRVVGRYPGHGEPGWVVEPGPDFVLDQRELDEIPIHGMASRLWDAGDMVWDVLFSEDDS